MQLIPLKPFWKVYREIRVSHVWHVCQSPAGCSVDCLICCPCHRLAQAPALSSRLLSFWVTSVTFLRPGEVSQASHNAPVLLKGSLARYPDHFSLQLPNNKNRQTGQGFITNCYKTNTIWCPVNLLDQLSSMFAAAPLDSPLLPFPTQPLASWQVISHVRILLVSLGFNPKQFSGHSFRIGVASKQMVPSHVIKYMGRWKSSCYIQYIPDPHKEVKRAFATLLDWLCTCFTLNFTMLT